MKGHARKRSVTGFTLIELVVAAAILAFAICGLLLLFVYCSFLSESNRNRTIAVTHAEYVMEEIRNAGLADFSTLDDNITAGDWDWDSDTEFDDAGLVRLVSENIDASHSGTDPLDVSVSVSWQNRPGRSDSLSLETLFTEQ